jgi:hypothetical protein
MNKRELLYEIDKFDEALQNHKYTEELIPVDKYFPYKLDERTLVRSDFESSIYVEDSFLMFYQTFFDKIKLNENAQQVSKSKYFNTLYYDYLKETKQEIKKDTFLQSLDENKKSKAETKSLAILNFFDNLLQSKRREIQEELKSKASSEKQLYKVISRKFDYEETMQLLGVIDVAMLIAIFLTMSVNIANKDNFLEWLIPVTFMAVIPINLGLLIYWLTHKTTKAEIAEIKVLPDNFKSYVSGGLIITSEDFFSPITFDYLDSFFDDSEVYLYLKNKYSKVEREDKITNE